MKNIKLFESFQLVPKKILNTGNEKFFGEAASTEYTKKVKDIIADIMRTEHSEHQEVAERESAMQMLKEEQQLDAIIHNCYNRNFRPQYAAEVAYHALIRGRMEALKERPSMFGGLSESEASVQFDVSAFKKKYDALVKEIEDGIRTDKKIKADPYDNVARLKTAQKIKKMVDSSII